MTASQLILTSFVADLDAALVTVVQAVAEHGFAEPTVQITPWLMPPDDAHAEPWTGCRVIVAGTKPPPSPVAPLASSWPPPPGVRVR